MSYTNTGTLDFKRISQHLYIFMGLKNYDFLNILRGAVKIRIGKIWEIFRKEGGRGFSFGISKPNNALACGHLLSHFGVLGSDGEGNDD